MNFLNTQNTNKNAHKISTPVNLNREFSGNAESMQGSINFLGAMGCAQVNMSNLRNKGVKLATEQFLNNPDFVQSHVDFCDSLTQRGIPLEKAILMTDKTFDVLSDENTYQ